MRLRDHKLLGTQVVPSIERCTEVRVEISWPRYQQDSRRNEDLLPNEFFLATIAVYALSLDFYSDISNLTN